MMAHEKPIVIVGAGIGGLACGYLLARQGLPVVIIEKRSRSELLTQTEGRSVNFTITQRGIRTLQKLGLANSVLKKAQSLRAREIHHANRTSRVQTYGPSEEDQIHSIRRTDLLQLLLQSAESVSGLRILFGTHVTSMDLDSLKMTTSNPEREIHARTIIGADGTHSHTRNTILKNLSGTFVQETFPWPYIEVTFSRECRKTLGFKKNHLHVVTGPDLMFIGMPNLDGTLTSMLLYRDAEISEADLPDTLKKQLPKLAPVLGELTRKLSGRKPSRLISLSVSHWHFKDKLVLIGDACHAVVPFYGQGMNCALEDALLLSTKILESKDLTQTYREFQRQRKQETDALRILSVEHFELFHQKGSFKWRLDRSYVHEFLSTALKRLWPHSYQMIASGRYSLSSAHRTMRMQERLLRFTGLYLIDLIVEAAFKLKRERYHHAR